MRAFASCRTFFDNRGLIRLCKHLIQRPEAIDNRYNDFVLMRTIKTGYSKHAWVFPVVRPRDVCLLAIEPWSDDFPLGCAVDTDPKDVTFLYKVVRSQSTVPSPM